MSAGSVAPQLAPTGAAASERWYAVWTRNQCEPKVEEGLKRRRFEVFLPRVRVSSRRRDRRKILARPLFPGYVFLRFAASREGYIRVARDRKSTRLNSSHGYISYAVFCLKKKKKNVLHH